MNMKRQVVLDTETTGFNVSGVIAHAGHNVIEIGAVEIINRKITGNNFNVYLKPPRSVEKDAVEIHGITNLFLKDKPIFRDIAQEFIEYIKYAQLIIHNADFDVGFLNKELEAANINLKIEDICSDIVDTLSLSRKIFPRKDNRLDGLCKRFNIDTTSRRNKHSALLDAELLAQVYLKMTSGQLKLEIFDNPSQVRSKCMDDNIKLNLLKLKVPILYASTEDLVKHKNVLNMMKNALWLKHK